MNEQEYKKESEKIIRYIKKETEEIITLIEDFGIISAARSLKRMAEVVECFKNRAI